MRCRCSWRRRKCRQPVTAVSRHWPSSWLNWTCYNRRTRFTLITMRVTISFLLPRTSPTLFILRSWLLALFSLITRSAFFLALIIFNTFTVASVNCVGIAYVGGVFQVVITNANDQRLFCWTLRTGKWHCWLPTFNTVSGVDVTLFSRRRSDTSRWFRSRTRTETEAEWMIRCKPRRPAVHFASLDGHWTSQASLFIICTLFRLFAQFCHGNEIRTLCNLELGSYWHIKLWEAGKIP